MVTESDDEDKSTSEEPDKTCQDAVAAYGQCGGDDYNGSTCCLDGYECQQMAVCYSEVHVVARTLVFLFVSGIYTYLYVCM